MSSDDSIDNSFESLAKGATKGALEWTSEKISDLVKRFRERNLAFIKEQKTIDIVREQYSSGEGKFYQRYIKDKDVLFIIRMGLTLRKIEDDGPRMSNLREKIFYKYKTRGLHIAEFVQNRLLNRYVGMLIDELESLDNLGKDIENVLKEIDKHVLFVQRIEKSQDIILKTLTIINSHSPSKFALSATKSAVEVIKECEDKLVSALTDYDLEVIREKETYNLFFKKKKTID
mgnify:FL=1